MERACIIMVFQIRNPEVTETILTLVGELSDRAINHSSPQLFLLVLICD